MSLLDRLFRRHRATKRREDAHAEARVEEAGRRLADLQERAERVSTTLHGRRERNHFTQIWDEIIHGRS